MSRRDPVTAACVALVLGCITIALFAAMRARRAEVALRGGRDGPPPPAAQELDDNPAPRARDQKARRSGVLDDLERTADDLAHDLKDLLTAITGRTELLIASLDEAHPGRPDACEIRRLALSGARIGKPLRALTASRAATDLIDVNLVTSRTADGFEVLLGRDIDVALALDPGVMQVRAGAGQVDEIVLNLAMRARAAMPQGGRLTLSTARHTRPDGHTSLGQARAYVRIVVADTGVDMPETDRETLSEPLLVTPGAGGVAIGLAKVCDIVKQAGGEIHVDSAPGLGTTFTVDLPAATEPAGAYAPSIARPVAALVLVVEDEPRIRELIKVVLSRGGHDVVAVAGPHEGLAVLNRQPAVELMLVDVVMPDMNGYDLAVQARALVPGLRVVFMSGFTRDLSRHPTRDRFLAKPFAIESLHDVVQQALSDP
jgi:two-component system, cell cycle sensor histidine kinase and response regulator CckA